MTVFNAGIYEVIATSLGLSCERRFNFTITPFQSLLVNYIVKNNFEPNQTVIVEASGGSGQYLYSFAGLPFQNNATHNVPDGGDITVIVKDINGLFYSLKNTHYMAISSVFYTK